MRAEICEVRIWQSEQRAEAEELTQGETESEADMIEQEESNLPERIHNITSPYETQRFCT